MADDYLLLTEDESNALDLAGCPVLHEQGQTVCRGVAERLDITPERWTLHVRSLEFLDKPTGEWRLGDATGQLSGRQPEQAFHRMGDLIEISGYGMVIWIAPKTEDPWRVISWPELDGWRGGKMAG